jgi:uncharacterized protein
VAGGSGGCITPCTRAGVCPFTHRPAAGYRRDVLTVSRLSVTPVRGLALHHPDHVELGAHGVVDDRRYTLLTDDGRVFDGTKLGPLVQVRAQLETDPERMILTFPSGEVVSDDVILGDPIQPVIYDRRFAARVVIGPWAEALSDYAGRPLRLIRSERRAGEPDRIAVSLASDASVDELARRGNDAKPLDARRFRMLVQVAGARPHQEDEWVGSEVRIGDVAVRVTAPVARCVITTQDPNTGHLDFPTLKAITAYRGLRDGRKIDFGVYADVVRPGRVSVGDEVIPASR